MKPSKLLIFSSLLTFAVALGVFIWVVTTSKALSYLSKDPEACINCHVMTPQYATWQKSSHAGKATCVECHLPVGNEVDKYIAKAKDGWNHSVAFTLNTYDQVIQITEDGASRVQANCVRCHATLTQTMRDSEARFHQNLGNDTKGEQRLCWDCHKDVPHGRVRSLSSTPNTLSVNPSK